MSDTNEHEESVEVFTFSAEGEALNGTFIEENASNIANEVCLFLDGLNTLRPSDDPVVITIAGGSSCLAPMKLTIKRTVMSRKQLDDLPEFEGW